MLNGIGISAWNLMLIFFGIICGIGWIHRTRNVTTLNAPQERNEPMDELCQPEEEFEDVFLVSEEDYETKPEATPPGCHPMALMMSQTQPTAPTRTLRLYRES